MSLELPGLSIASPVIWSFVAASSCSDFAVNFTADFANHSPTRRAAIDLLSLVPGCPFTHPRKVHCLVLNITLIARSDRSHRRISILLNSSFIISMHFLSFDLHPLHDATTYTLAVDPTPKLPPPQHPTIYDRPSNAVITPTASQHLHSTSWSDAAFQNSAMFTAASFSPKTTCDFHTMTLSESGSETKFVEGAFPKHPDAIIHLQSSFWSLFCRPSMLLRRILCIYRLHPTDLYKQTQGTGRNRQNGDVGYASQHTLTARQQTIPKGVFTTEFRRIQH